MLPFAEKWVHKIGVKKVFLIGAIGISPLPALWTVSQEIWFAVLLQSISGIFWALYEVALTVIFFSQIKSHQKIPVLTLFNLFNSLALVLGSLIGGRILNAHGESVFGYYFIFVFGAGLRTIISCIYAYKLRHLKDVL